MNPIGAFYMHNMTAGWWLFTILIAIALWGAAIWIAVTVVRTRREPRDQPLAILDRRLAVGEISVEEYEARRAALAGKQDPEIRPGYAIPSVENPDVRSRGRP
jgi:uncharacterized membrane protein